jgi:deoxyribonuclease (pyrimidine dimer)
MTRINLVEVEELADQHLFAEYRELPRMADFYNKTVKQEKDISEKFILNTGHMTFFLNKAKYLEKRHKQITKELRTRNINFTERETFKMPVGNKFKQINWNPCEEEIKISRERIQEKINQKPHFYRWTKRI